MFQLPKISLSGFLKAVMLGGCDFPPPTRYFPIVIFAFSLGLILPTHAWAHTHNPPFFSLSLLFIPIMGLMIAFTFWSGGYRIIFKDAPAGSSGREWLYFRAALVILIAVAGFFSQPLWLYVFGICATLYALYRGAWLIYWGRKIINENPPAFKELSLKSGRLNISGMLLIILTLGIAVTPEFYLKSGIQERKDVYVSDAKSNLHNVWLACKAYWAVQGGDNSCTLNVASLKEYGFIKSSWVTVVVEKTVEEDFLAFAFHKESPNKFKIDSQGHISEVEKEELPVRRE